MNQPVTYKEWRSVYHRELQALGYHVFVIGHVCKSSRTSIATTRDLSRRCRRLDRIRARMRACRHADDPTWGDALLDLVYGPGQRPIR